VKFGTTFFFDATGPSGPGPPHSRGFNITRNDAPQSVGLLRTCDQLVAETSTWQHTTVTTNRHVSHGLSVHHQELKTVHTATGICQKVAATCC